MMRSLDPVLVADRQDMDIRMDVHRLGTPMHPDSGFRGGNLYSQENQQRNEKDSRRKESKRRRR